MGRRKEQREDMAEQERMYLCWLCSVPGIGSRTAGRLLALCPDAREIYRAGEKLWRQALTDRQLEQMRLYAKTVAPGALWETLDKKDIRFVTLSDKDYPRRLLHIPDPPRGLFVKGRLPDNEPLSVALIGARDCSEYGKFVADGIGEELGRCGVQIISGMARGIDGIGQEAALRSGGSSFGVLGCGVDICYPAANRRLYEKLCERGGLLSAYPPGTEARAGHFPPRNRIVSGLADALIVVEARVKSGTLITVDMALEQGREVYAVPGRVTDRLSDGCNRLIEQGAGVFLTPEDFLREWGQKRSREDEGKRREKPPARGQLTPEKRQLCEVMDCQPMSLEQIQERLLKKGAEKYTMPELMAQLMGLCMEKIAVQVSPGQFALRAGAGGRPD